MKSIQKFIILVFLLFVSKGSILAQKSTQGSKIILEAEFHSEMSDTMLIGKGAASYILGNGDYFYVDNSVFSIMHFNKEGILLNKFGRMGRGPGEFHEINDIYIKNELIYALDYKNARVQVFSISGDFIKTIKLSDSSYMGNELIVDKKGRVQLLGFYKNENLFVHLHDSSGNYIDSFGEFIDFSQFFMNTNGKLQLTQLHATEDDNGFYYTIGAPLRIFHFDNKLNLKWEIEDDVLPNPWEDHIKVTPTTYSSRFYPASFNSIIIDKWLIVYWLNPEKDSRNSYLELRSKENGELISRKELGYSNATISLGIDFEHKNRFYVLTKNRELNTFSLLNMKID